MELDRKKRVLKRDSHNIVRLAERVIKLENVLKAGMKIIESHPSVDHELQQNFNEAIVGLVDE